MKTDAAPATGKITDRPTSAGKWKWKPLSTIANVEATYFWIQHPSNEDMIPVTVTETPAAGLLCKELHMGGSIHCGFQPWSGIWRKAA